MYPVRRALEQVTGLCSMYNCFQCFQRGCTFAAEEVEVHCSGRVLKHQCKYGLTHWARQPEADFWRKGYRHAHWELNTKSSEHQALNPPPHPQTHALWSKLWTVCAVAEKKESALLSNQGHICDFCIYSQLFLLTSVCNSFYLFCQEVRKIAWNCSISWDACWEKRGTWDINLHYIPQLVPKRIHLLILQRIHKEKHY